ncbi:MAG: Crp/Fnr family transcriptional regulator [Planctomycetes bacterium]|nr:Crp/Fnr family transcriptional regulator [Planctomycetota bacterium]
MGRITPTEVTAAVRNTPLFSALSGKELQKLLQSCPIKSFPATTQVFSPLQTANCFYVILAGKIKLYQLSAKGDEQILHLYGPGNTFGEAAMWSGVRYPAFADAMTDSVLLSVCRLPLKKLIDDNAGLAIGMLAGMSSKLLEFNELIGQLSLREVPERLANVLLGLPARPGTKTITLKQTKRELAAQIGTIAETLSRALGKLKAQGLIEVNGSEITILDAAALADFAGIQYRGTS